MTSDACPVTPLYYFRGTVPRSNFVKSHMNTVQDPFFDQPHYILIIVVCIYTYTYEKIEERERERERSVQVVVVVVVYIIMYI